MVHRNLYFGFFLMTLLGVYPVLGYGQQVKNVLEAFEGLSSEPEVIIISNKIAVPSEEGHLQGVQVIEKNGNEKLLISGSSLKQAYILQVDLATQKTDTLISLMKEPYRHAGGIQVNEPYIVVGIEDNFTKTASKVCLYNYREGSLYKAQPTFTMDRKGEPKQQTAGSTGLLAIGTGYLMVVSNWDSRNWDFYHINPEQNKQKMLASFAALDDWASYQSINLISDEETIYAIGFYSIEHLGYADLIVVSNMESFKPIMEKVRTKTFNGTNKVDFGAAAGLQVDKEGNLYIWGTQRDPLKRIAVNKFSQH